MSSHRTLEDGERILTINSTTLTQYRTVTDRRQAHRAGKKSRDFNELFGNIVSSFQSFWSVTWCSFYRADTEPYTDKDNTTCLKLVALSEIKLKQNTETTYNRFRFISVLLSYLAM